MIIGIAGNIGSGKDTVGRIIQFLTSSEHLIDGWNRFDNWSEAVDGSPINSKWQIKKFADKLKDIVCILLGCTRQQLEDREFKERELGKEWNKWLLKEHWINDESVEYTTEIHFSTKKELDDYVKDLNHNDYTCTKVGLVKLTVRKLLQLLGTECGRNIIHPNIWVNSLMSGYKAHHKGRKGIPPLNERYSILICQNPKCKKAFDGYKRAIYCPECVEDDNFQTYPNWIVTDVRFHNEAEAIKARGGIIIKVNRDVKTNNHQSETALNSWKFDYTLDNNGTIEDLVNNVKNLNLEL